MLDANELSALFARAAKKPKVSSIEILRERFANNIFFDKSLESFFENLFAPHAITIPKNLNAILREYQKKGIEWGEFQTF